MSSVKIEGIEDFQKFFDEHQTDPVTIIVFKGSVDESGKQWCSDCEAAEPFLVEGISKSIHGATAVVGVGQKEEWKNCPENPFRTHLKTRLQGVPTLIRYHHGSEIVRLVEGQLLNEEMVNEIFSS